MAHLPGPQLLESIFHHLALPPKVPERQESRLDKIGEALADRLLRATILLRDATYEQFGPCFDTVRRAVLTAKTINAGGKLNQISLLTAFRELQGNDLLIVHVGEQNAALLIRRMQDANGWQVLFEAFETSPLSEEVLATKAALEWDFPGCAVAVPLSTFQDDSFQLELASFLSQASKESIKRFAARTNKAGSFAYESRDTVDPALITSMLMTLLEVNGSRKFPPILRKRVRDDVCWSDGENPWRRCPFWLVLRVGIQRHLCELVGGEVGRLQYKFLLAQVSATLLEDSLYSLGPESLAFLKTKLCRRLTKLEVDGQRANTSEQIIYNYMFTRLRSDFSKVIKRISVQIELAWTNFKQTLTRHVRPLPKHADQRHLQLSLPNSRNYIQQVQIDARNSLYASNHRKVTPKFDLSSPAVRQARDFAERYFNLANLEEIQVSSLCDDNTPQERCIILAGHINTYMNHVGNSYESQPEQLSTMLLTIMELWMEMDKVAGVVFSLLLEFSPLFPPRIMDVLQLADFRDMTRLQKVRSYLEGRHNASKGNQTIFDNPSAISEQKCFAERYLNESPDSAEMQELFDIITTNADRARRRKEEEWEEKCQKFEELNRTIAESSCQYIESEFEGKIHNKRCKKCFLERKAYRFNMRIHEHPLPSSISHAKAVVFELSIPKAFQVYRDATWRIINTLALAEIAVEQEPRVLLHEYSELQRFMRARGSQICLASTTKSFLNTHYANPRFPVAIEGVTLGCGLKLEYFDSGSKTWIGRSIQKLSFRHHCKLILPVDSPFSVFLSMPEFEADSNGPSSYATIASQTKLPPKANIQEYLSYQTLYSGKARRWPQILVELGSTNLNFSTESASLFMNHLALKVGPANGSDPLGIVHGIFRDPLFSRRLLEHLSHRVESISSNYREAICMETMTTLTIRLCSLNTTLSGQAAMLLERIREITLKWMDGLRTEIRLATNAESSRAFSRYALWAALLCRRTFVIYLDAKHILNSGSLTSYIQSSITLQDNLVSETAALPLLLNSALIRDLKTIHRLRYILKKALEENPHCLLYAICSILPSLGDSTENVFSQHQFKETWWLEITINANASRLSQTVHFHVLEGILLIQGQPVGKLPAEYQNAIVLSQLFGNQSLLTYPSSVPGMSFMLALNMKGHEIHLGFRREQLVIRALTQHTTLELIPDQVFGGPSSFDLPSSLVGNCVHWLDLNTGIIEVRQRPHIWKTKASNWKIDMRSWQARRNKVTLVDPHSPLFQRVARIFGYFEHSVHLTVFQPDSGTLTVDLRRLELSFSVNKRNLFASKQLQSEIDLDQCAGTWFGLLSMIVLREITSGWDSIPLKQRSIIVPLGTMSYKKRGIHVGITIENTGDYGRYAINDVLGRLDCPAEPRLLYLKAQYHAFTSFVIPDPLTGRTGTEEAFQCLSSGLCQPWAPLTCGPADSLVYLSHLSPMRNYYPSGMKVMAQVHWDPELTTTIQNDGFRDIVEGIYAKSEQLSIFEAQQTALPALKPAGERHLNFRSHARRQIHERSNLVIDSHAADTKYSARDGWRTTRSRYHVFECTGLIYAWPSKMITHPDIASILQSWSSIGGYSGSFDKVLLSDLLDTRLSTDWGSLVTLCQSSTKENMYHLMFLFATMSFRPDTDMNAIKTLIAFAVIGSLKDLVPPKWPLYSHFKPGNVPSLNSLISLIKPCLIPYGDDERTTLGFSLTSKHRRKLEAAQSRHEMQSEEDTKTLANFLLRQWPCAEPTIEGFSAIVLINIEDALKLIRDEWLRLFQNFELSQHISVVQEVLDSHRSTEQKEHPVLEVPEQTVFPIRCRGGEFPTLSQLLKKTGIAGGRFPGHIYDLSQTTVAEHNQHYLGSLNHKKENIKAPMISILTKRVDSHSWPSRENQELRKIIDTVTNSKSTVRQQYGNDLLHSLNALSHASNSSSVQDTYHPVKLTNDLTNARRLVSHNFAQISSAFESQCPQFQWLQQGCLWPSVTPISLLQTLRSSIHVSSFGSGLRENLVQFALSVTALQRLIRIEYALLKKSKQTCLEEQKNLGHENWNPLEHTDWLLLEVDSNMLFRPGQIEVTLATIKPAGGSNSVLQMNMGQGKTSCIMPMAAAVLANGDNLVRVIIPKSLLIQTAQLLHSRLGGLLGRELRHIPFSRKTSTKSETIKAFFDVHKAMRISGGVMLALPEHLLSFKLSGLQRISDGLIPEASSMIRVQSWLEHHSRDILDEVDYILAIKTQLIYPSGSQKSMDGHPHRWEIIEALLKQVNLHLWNLQKAYPQSIEVVPRDGGGFPLVYFLRKDVEDELISRLVDDVYRGRGSLLPDMCTKSERQAVKYFISLARPSLQVQEQIRQLFPDKPAIKKIVFQLRGLLVHRILLMCLKKRWSVQYGLHPTRDPIAVPFHAKGTPTEQSEWGHPDVFLMFTCLAFYYDGLNLTQLRQALEHVLKSDDPSQIYDALSQTSKLPDSLRDWNAVNIDDAAQLHEIWTHVRHQIIVIDYFLNNFVFPQHAKQFQLKLQASGWDIPLSSVQCSVSSHAQPTKPLTTGFSGTNDWKRMLPLTIKQQDLPGLAHTNAEVLTYLLQPRSRRYEIAADYRGKRLTEVGLLERFRNKGIRVFIDAGAQILEMDNFTLAKTWLEIAPEAPAVVYFNKSNKPFVLYPKGHQVPLLASPYADDLADCLVYLDEAHTRGTDLKMPATAIGALTLGLGQTKDHTVQAAMRLRQLATTQAVAFFAPPEVHQSILDVRKKKSFDHIDSFDVICWLLEQTCSGIEQLQPLYFSQGIDYCRRAQAALDNPNFLVDPDQRKAYLASLRKFEQQTLEQLYGITTKVKHSANSGPLFPGIESFMKELNRQRKSFQDTGNAVQGSVLQEVEQEREVAFEVENVREVQKPIHYLPYLFPGLSRDIISFARTGRFTADSSAYREAFTALRKTSLSRKYGISSEGVSGKLYVSTEFTKTVKFPSDRSYDNFLRSVNWLLWSPSTGIAMIIIPEEADALLPMLRATQQPLTHLLTYAAPITRKMLHFNNLTFYSVPELPQSWRAPKWLRVELGIIAGRLYFQYEEYDTLCKYLCVKENPQGLEEDSGEEEDETTNVLNTSEQGESLAQPQSRKSFTKKPLIFMQEWLAIKRKGQDFSQSPMGYVCQGKPLREDHPFFVTAEAPRKQKALMTTTTRLSEEDDDEDPDVEFYDADEYGPDVGNDDFDDADLTDREDGVSEDSN